MRVEGAVTAFGARQRGTAMRNRWTGLALAAAVMISAGPAYAQYLVSPESAAPAAPIAEPIPFGPSTCEGPPTPPYPPPQAGGGCPSNCLPDNLPNISTPPPLPCEPCRLYTKIDYLHWWMKGDNLQNTLVTTSAVPSIANNFGAINQTQTQVLAGDGYVHQGPMDGVRATLGINPKCFVPIEITGFWVHTNSRSILHSEGRESDPLLARAIFSLDPTVLQESVYLAAFPRLAAGTVNLSTSTWLWGAEANAYICHLWGSPDTIGMVVDLTAGARYAALNEDLDISNSITSRTDALRVSYLGTRFGRGFTTAVVDSFHTRNTFYGAQGGIRTALPIRCFTLELKGDVGAGVNYQILSVMGSSTLYSPPAAAPFLTPAPQTAGGGIQAVASNSGRFTRQRFSVLGDFGVALELPVFEWLSLSVGYDLIAWSNVVRPGSQLSRYVDTRQVPTDVNFTAAAAAAATTPPPTFNESTFYAQGLTISLSFQY